MLISCNCLNLLATSNHKHHQQQEQQQQQIVKDQEEKLTSGTGNVEDDGNSSSPPTILHGINLSELRKQQKVARIYSECLEFLRKSIGPLNDLNVTITQNDLLYKVPIDTWLFHYCINCCTVTHAKHTSDGSYLINSSLLTNNEEVNRSKLSKSYSQAFGIIMIDHNRPTNNNQNNKTSISGGHIDESNSVFSTAVTSSSTGGITSGSNVMMAMMNTNNSNINYHQLQQQSSITGGNNKNFKQNRIINLTQQLNTRLQKEIFDTDERIHRYTEQQFALLKNFREKSEQEFQILINLINHVPETLKVIDSTIVDSNITSNASGCGLSEGRTAAAPATRISETLSATNSSVINNKISVTGAGAIIDNANSSSVFNFKQQVPNLDTPPATPDSTPMSVGNSPTFKPHSTANTVAFINNDSDCLFELEGMESTNYPPQEYTSSGGIGGFSTEMSDVEETEDAEDALGELETGIPISKSRMRKGSLHIAKSLPISIANANEINTNRFAMDDTDDEGQEESNVDIAASIKALAKSVHGDTVFGDLPRPRFSTQI